jgi:hypothetical protein
MYGDLGMLSMVSAGSPSMRWPSIPQAETICRRCPKFEQLLKFATYVRAALLRDLIKVLLNILPPNAYRPRAY